MSKRPLSNLSNVPNNLQSQNNQSTSLKRRIDNDNLEGSNKKSKNLYNDIDQENGKISVFKKILPTKLIIENIANSNLKLPFTNKKNVIKNETDKSLINSSTTDFQIKDKDQDLIDNLNKLTKNTKQKKKIYFGDPLNYYEQPKNLPDDIEDYDLTNIDDINAEPQFSYDIFEYYFQKEKQLVIPDYINKQPEITKLMRSILVDWLVELQEILHLNHETTYLSVKIIDHYLSKVKCSKSIFQLLGATAVLIASKYDSRFCPSINQLLYISDNAFTKEQMIEMEKKILSKIDFYLGMPLSYRFLRRYARCAGLSMETLTFARYILETCLLEYDFIMELDSKMAASCLLLVFKSKKELNLQWTKTLEFYTHYKESDLLDLMNRINKFMNTPLNKSIKTIKEKYLTSTYFKVASYNLLPIEDEKKK